MAKDTRKSDKSSTARNSATSDLNAPWIQQRTGLIVMALTSAALVIFMAWQLWPTEGPLRAILWGLGMGLAIWIVFLISLAFHRAVRR